MYSFNQSVNQSNKFL